MIEQIDDVLRREANGAGRQWVDIPERVDGERFLRMPCPFCGGSRAWLDYEGGWFRCPHEGCKRDVTTGPAEREHWMITRFRRQIDVAARKVTAKFTYGQGEGRATWLPLDEATYYAEYLVWNYACGKPGQPHDAGRLDDWWTDCLHFDDPPGKLDSYVQQALNGDLHNFAKTRAAAWERHPTAQLAEDHAYEYDVRSPNRGDDWLPNNDGIMPPRRAAQALADADSPDAQLNDYPLLQMKYRDGLTNKQIGLEIGVGPKVVAKRIADETADYMRDHKLQKSS